MKQLFIFRGLPGAGKSKSLEEFPKSAVVCSADKLFEKKGEYNFNPSQLGQAHAACQFQALDAMSHGEPLVIIDNTHSRHWEFAIYQKMGEVFGYEIQVRMIGGTSYDHVRKYAKRNIHEVPEDTILRMAYRWEP